MGAPPMPVRPDRTEEACTQGDLGVQGRVRTVGRDAEGGQGGRGKLRTGSAPETQGRRSFRKEGVVGQVQSFPQWDATTSLGPALLLEGITVLEICAHGGKTSLAPLTSLLPGGSWSC